MSRQAPVISNEEVAALFDANEVASGADPMYVSGGGYEELQSGAGAAITDESGVRMPLRDLQEQLGRMDFRVGQVGGSRKTVRRRRASRRKSRQSRRKQSRGRRVR